MAAPSGRLDAVVLAAGYGTRMQALKPLLPLEGATVLAKAVETFRGVAAQTWVVVGHRGEDLEPEIRRLGARCVRNPDFAGGMFTSVTAGLRALPPEVAGCFLLPADIPAVRPHTSRVLASVFRRTGADVVHPAFGERGHPPVLSARLFGEILAGADGGLRTILARHEARSVQVDVLDEGVLFDLDTPDDYRRAQALAKGRTAPTAAEVAALLDGLAAPEALRRHGLAVAEVALHLAEALGAAGVALDWAVVRAAALLHDVAKGTPDHARAGALLLRRCGYPAVARAIARHTELAFADGAALSEAALVYLADKLVSGDQLVSLEQRRGATLARHGQGAEARAAIERRHGQARAVAQAVEALAGAPVERLAAGARTRAVGAVA
jgi:molybdenum cofactor cytidylyltransferase